MGNKKELQYLMRLNKQRLDDAEDFIETLADDINVNYWKGVKYTAEANIKALQSFGISAKTGE